MYCIQFVAEFKSESTISCTKFINEYYSLYLSDKELYNKLKKLGFEIINYIYEGNDIGNYYALYKLNTK